MIINRNIWTVEPYVYKATLSGVDVYDLSSNSLISSSTIAGGANYVWANDQYVYAATSGIGLCRSQNSLPLSFSTYKTYPEITSDIVNCVHGNGDYLCVTTVSGVDRYNIPTGDRLYINSNNVCKCFQNSNGDYYYVTNDFVPVVGIGESIFEWAWSLYFSLSSPITINNYEYRFEIPFTQECNIYGQASIDGSDLRVISTTGVSLPYCIDMWDHINSPVVYVRLPLSSVGFYVIWGNKNASRSYSQSDVFMFYDDFSKAIIDSNKWTIDKSGDVNSTITVVDGHARFKSYYTANPVSLVSKTTFSGAALEYSVRKYQYHVSYPNNVGVTASFVGSTTASIGDVSTSQFTPHKLISGTPQVTVSGTKYIYTSFNTHTLIDAPGIQRSVFDGEILTTSGVSIITDRAVKISQSSQNYSPYIEVDWVRVRNYSNSAPTYSVPSNAVLIENLSDFAAVHSVYTSGGGFSYTSGKNSFFNASYINDIFITENTSIHGGGSVMFVATDHGVTVLEENRGDEGTARKRVYLLET